MAHFVVMHTSPIAGGLAVNGVAYSPVPGGNNDAGVAWSDVAIGYMGYRNRRHGGGSTAKVTVDPAIQAQLDAGTLLEWVWEATIPAGTPNPAAVQLIRDAVNAQEAAMMSRLGSLLRYWGFEGESV